MEEIGKSLPGILRGYLRRESPHLIEVLAPLWPRVAGPTIAQHSRPVFFSAGTLIVETASEVWAAQLGQMGEEIRAEINGCFGVPLVKRFMVRESSRLETGRAGTFESGRTGRSVPRGFRA
ncbi:MAG TPA: DUF721 domain-containing protein [Terriglobia bacterium]|nr:DUF721 domain-containing protein [Terriglobia bacterium]